ALGCLEYVADIERACRELARVTRSGGTVLYVVELCGADKPDGPERLVPFLDDWTRRRASEPEVVALAHALFEPVELDRVEGYVLEDSGLRVQYMRVIGTRRTTLTDTAP